MTPQPHDQTASDQELIAAMNRGDDLAFEVLYYRYRDWVVNLAFRVCGDQDLSLDVLQETFGYFLRKFPGFRLTAQFKTFLYPVVRNLAIAAHRQARRHQSTAAELERLESLPAATHPAAESETLATVLALLTEEHRETLWLRYVDGLSLAEVAQAMNLPLGTVKSRIHGALEILRRDERTKKLFAE